MESQNDSPEYSVKISDVDDAVHIIPEKVTRVEITENVRSLGNWDFSGASYHEIQWSGEVKVRGWGKLEQFQVASQNPCFQDIDGVLFSKDGKKLIAYPPAKRENIYNIPEGTEAIVAGAFQLNQYIEKIFLPDSVTEIGRYAFYGDINLTEIRLSNAIKEIPDAAFMGCRQLCQLRLPAQLQKLGGKCFAGMNLSEIQLPDTLQKISYSVFRGNHLRKLTLPSGIKRILSSFTGCHMDELTIYDDSICENIADAIPYGTNCLFIIRSAISNEVKYKVWMINNYNESDKIKDLYKECWGEHASFDFQKTDNVFEKIKDIQDKILTAMYRLQYPVQLSEEKAFKYRSFLKRNGYKRLTVLIEQEKLPDIQQLVLLGAFSKSKSNEIIEQARKKGNKAILSFLMDYQRQHFPNAVDNDTYAHQLALSEEAKPMWKKCAKNPSLIGRYLGTEKIVEFPLQFEGNAITGTANLTGNVPENYSEITDVVIPEGYTELGNATFKGCVQLKSITLPSTLERIGNHCFEDCRMLKEIVLPANVCSIGTSAFVGCESLERVDLDAKLEKLGTQCFYGLRKLDTVIYRGKYVSSPEKVCFSYPRYVYTDGVIAASGLYNYPMPLSYIGLRTDDIANAADTNYLKGHTIYIAGELKALPSIRKSFAGLIDSEFIRKLGGTYVSRFSKAVDIVICFSIDKENSAIKKAIDNRVAIIPEKEFLTTIKEGKQLDLSKWVVKSSMDKPVKKAIKASSKDDPYRPAAMKKMWAYSLLEDGTIEVTDYKGTDTEVEVPARIGDSIVSSIGESTFDACRYRISPQKQDIYKKITRIKLPPSIRTIGTRAFSDCSSLTEINIPNEVTTIKDQAFSGCISLEQIALPDSLKELGTLAFEKCERLSKIHLPLGITTVGAGVFKKCKSLADGDGFVIFNNTLYEYVGEKKEIVIPENVETIGQTSIGYNGPYYHPGDSVTKVTIPDSVKHIDYNAFSYCDELQEVIVPTDLTDIKEAAFEGCKKLADEDGFIIVNGMLFDYIKDESDIVIPSRVNHIMGGFIIRCIFNHERGINSKKKLRFHIPSSVAKVDVKDRFGSPYGPRLNKITFIGTKDSIVEKVALENGIDFKTE